MASGRSSIVVAAALGVLLLAGCAAPATGEPEPAAAPTASAAPVDAAPSVRVPLDCADLVDAAELEDLTGAALPAVDPFVDGSQSLVQTADEQYGALDCAWSTSPLDNDQSIPSVVVTVIPDVSPERWAEFTPMLAGDGTETGSYGADSHVYCSPPRPEYSSCTLNSLVGRYWLSVAISAPGPGVTAASAAPVLDRATIAVTAAGQPSARWVSPSAASALAGDLDTVAAQTALGASSLEYAVDGVSTQNGARWLPAVETGMTRGFYVATDMPNGATVEFELDFLPSGAWAYDVIRERVGSTTAVDALGDAAFNYASSGNSTVVFTIGDDLVLVDATAGGTAVSADLAVTLAKAIVPAVN